MSNSGKITLTDSGGLATITFSHPQSNCLPGALLTKLADSINSIAQDHQIKAILLRSEGEGAFCAGASFDELRAVENVDQARRFFSGFAAVILAMRRAPQPIVARVQGKAVGGGVGLIAAADYAIALDSAAVKLSELSIGIGPFIIGPALVRKIGVGPFSAMALDAEWRDAEWARQHSLYAMVCTDPTGLDLAVKELTQRLCAANVAALAKLKAVFWEGTEGWEDLLPRRVGYTAELACSEFVKKRIAELTR